MQVAEISSYRRATAAEVLAVHRAPYLELLERLVRSKAPAAVESAPTYITHSSYDDAFHVRCHLLAMSGARIPTQDALLLSPCPG